MKAVAAILAMASAVNAHMIMRTPVPAGNPDSSPLSTDGSNFPCKTGPGQLDTSNPNVMSIGSANTLSFTGSATHGGGSCQVSLAKGTSLSADTKWMVIHSIEGGCPAPNNNNQNLGNDPQGTGASSFQFTIPDHPDLGAGDYTLAWSWNNRIGNREFYMNCAYVQLQGATKKRYAPSKPAVSKRQQAALPDMFVANLDNGCSVTEGTDVQYPNPGDSVEIGPGANLAAPVGNCGSSGSSNPAPANPGGNGQNPSSAFAPSATGGYGGGNQGGRPTSAAGNFGPGNDGQYTQSTPNVFATVTGGNTGATGVPDNGQVTQSQPGVFVTVTSGAQTATSAAQAPSAPVPTASSQPEPSSPAVAPIGTGSPSPPTSGSSTAGSACSDEGAWSCAADGSSFQRCASGVWSVSMAMPAGVSCTPGVSANFAMAASGGRAKRDKRSHIARARHNMHVIS